MLIRARLLEIVLFEWRHHARQPATFAAMAFFVFFGVVVQANGFGQANVAVNSPWVVMLGTGFLSLMSVFAVAVFAADAILRDVEHRMDGIVFTTSVEKAEYLGGRFAGALLAALTVMALGTIAMAATMFTPLVDVDRVAPFAAGPYVESFFTMTVPNVVVAAVLMFAIAALTRSTLATYAGAVVLYVFYFVVAALTNSPLMAASKPGAGSAGPVALLDPFGLSAFFDSTRLWTAAAKNGRSVAFEPLLLANRCLWLLVAAAVLVLLYRRFSFRAAAQRGTSLRSLILSRRFNLWRADLQVRSGRSSSSGRRAREVVDGPRLPYVDVRQGRTWRSALQRYRPTTSRPFASCFALQLRILGSRPFLGLLLVWTGLAASEIYSDVLSVEYGAALIPTTGLVIASLADPLDILGTVLILFVGAELYWREQRYRFTSILDTTPLSNVAILSAKAATLAVLVVVVIAAGILPGFVLQLVRAPEHITPSAYLALFASSGIPLLATGMAVLLIHALVRNKYAGIVASLLFVIVTKQPSLVGLQHPLWCYGALPPLRHSEVSGFGSGLPAMAALAIHWLVVATLLFLVASGFWRTRRELPVRAIAVALLISVATGSWLFAKIGATEDVNDWKAGYERKYRPLASLPQPRATGVDTAIEFFDDRVHVSARYELVNPHRVPVSRILVAVRREAKDVLVEIRGARVQRDAPFGMVDLALDRPLPSGGRTELRFAATLKSEPFELDGDDSIAPRSSFLLSFEMLPTIGYRNGWEIVDPPERRKHGLPPRAETFEADVPPFAEDIRFAATISTPIDQTPVGPGTLDRSWTRGARRYARFTHPSMRNFFAAATASYTARKEMHGATEIELLHVAKHGQNGARTLDIAARSLAQFESSFGPYGSPQLRLAEVPSTASFGALATPNTIFLTEHRTLLIDGRDPSRPDLLARRIAHEVAHQWWGYRVAPASAPGSTFVVESLAKYGELRVVEKLRGAGQVRRMLEVDRDRYLAGRADDPESEVPLLRVAGQAYLYYGKGSIVMHAIRDLVGEARLDEALRSFVAAESSRHGLTRAADLLPHLRRVVTSDQYTLIHEWLSDITLYDLAIDSVRREGKVLTFRAVARKWRVDAEGHELARPFREPITIRVTGANGETLYEERHLLDGEDVLTIPVPGRPAEVEIDPSLTRIDRDLRNNAQRVE